MQATPTPTPIPAAATWLTLASGWIALGFLALLGIAVLYYVFTERIDLSKLISEPNGDASMARFQLLIFTFVIAASLFLIIAAPSPPAFPEQIPQGILILLGISASSYLVSKGIQFSTPEGVRERSPEVKVTPATSTTKADGDPIQFKAEVFGLASVEVRWSLEPDVGMGEIGPGSGLYIPPQQPPASKGLPSIVTVRATSTEDNSVSGTATVTIA